MTKHHLLAFFALVYECGAFQLMKSYRSVQFHGMMLQRDLKMAFDTFVEVGSSFEAKCSPVGPQPPNSVNSEGFLLSLSDYMRLPVDQYVCIKMPLDAVLERDRSPESNDCPNRFILTVPPGKADSIHPALRPLIPFVTVRFFNLDVSPRLVCNVVQTDDSVVIRSNECVLRGSPFVESLNGCFKIDIKTVFKWKDAVDAKSILSTSK